MKYEDDSGKWRSWPKAKIRRHVIINKGTRLYLRDKRNALELIKLRKLLEGEDYKYIGTEKIGGKVLRDKYLHYFRSKVRARKGGEIRFGILQYPTKRKAKHKKNR